MFCQQPVITMSSGGRDNGCTPLQRWQPVHAKILHTSRRCMRTEVSSELRVSVVKPLMNWLWPWWSSTAHSVVVPGKSSWRQFRCLHVAFLPQGATLAINLCGSRRTVAVNHDNQVHPHHYARRPKTILECRWNCDLSWVPCDFHRT